jgi:hypothetical protein
MDAPRTLWTDRPIQTRNEDRLNFADYADILADIILTADTPITLGIFGPWGSGKTSLMRLIAERLIGQRTPGHRRAQTVWLTPGSTSGTRRPSGGPSSCTSWKACAATTSPKRTPVR